MDSKKELRDATPIVVDFLNDKVNLKNFLNEAIFNIDEASFLIIQDNTYREDNCLHVFSKQTIGSRNAFKIEVGDSKNFNFPYYIL